MLIEIKHRFTDAVIYSCEAENIKEAVKKALEDKANLWGANLEGANLESANLRGANLWGANLWGANLWGANLEGANLESANLRGANLRGANLWSANLWGANLWGANLWGANLWGANLWGANLEGANLWGANLWGANLWGANLEGANLEDAKISLEVPTLQKPFTQVLNAINQPNCKLKMSDWHYCETTHCVAGWINFLADKQELEGKTSPLLSAKLILRENGYPDFDDSLFFNMDEEEVIKELKVFAEKEGAQ